MLELHPTDVDTHTHTCTRTLIIIRYVRKEMFNSASGVIITLDNIIYSGIPL